MLLILLLSHDHLTICLLSFAACLQVFNRDNTSSSFSKDVGMDVSEHLHEVTLASSSKPDENGTLPNQLSPQQMRHNCYLWASTISAEMARNRQLIWKLAKQSEACLDRLIVLGNGLMPSMNLPTFSISVLAINQLTATVEGAVGALQQFNELLDHPLNSGRF